MLTFVYFFFNFFLFILVCSYDRNDPVFAMRGSMHSIRRDMLMLENQLPLMPTYMPSTKIENSQENNNKFFHPIADKDKEELHCLDVFRRSVLQPSLKPEPRLSRRWSWKPVVADKRQQKLLHCVTELREAGIKFKRRKSDRLWDIQFKNGCLEIPKLLIHDGKFTFSFLLVLNHILLILLSPKNQT